MGLYPRSLKVGSHRVWIVVTTLPGIALLAQSADTLRLGQISGIVRDTAGNAIPNVEIVFRPSSRRLVTTEDGQFMARGFTSGTHVVLARKVGFVPESIMVRVAAGGAAEASFALRLHAEALESVLVTARKPISAKLQGFEERRQRRNGGQFVTREQIERRGSIATADVLRYVQGIKMVDSMGVTIAISTRGAKVNFLIPKQVEACVVRVGVDGSIKDPMFSVNQIPTRDIHGIEVYAGAASMPPEFNSTVGRNAQCGLIMIWTRTQ